jgi:hypothetical protein
VSPRALDATRVLTCRQGVTTVTASDTVLWPSRVI